MTTVHPRSEYDRPPLSDEEIARLWLDQPDDPIRLPSGCLACRTCGVAVQIQDQDEGQVIQVESAGQAIEGPGVLSQAVANQRRIPLRFALCPACRHAAELAEQLTGDPAHRSPWALQQVNCALDALRYLAPTSIEIAPWVQVNLNPERLTALVRRLAQLGVTARWINRFVPVIMPGADSRTCTRYPFAHLKIGQRADLRTAYAALLKERVASKAPPVRVSPPRVTGLVGGASPLVPIQDGCLFCGVGHQTVPAATVAQQGLQNVARDLWTPKRVGAQQLGPPSPASVSGYLCRVCADAVEYVHSIGPTALERALVVALAPEKVGILPYGNLSVNGLIGWGVLVVQARQANSPAPDPVPNSQPWEHLGDIEKLAEQLSWAEAVILRYSSASKWCHFARLEVCEMVPPRS